MTTTPLELDPPPTRAPRPSTEERVLTGRRVLVGSWDDLTGMTWTSDLRAVSEVLHEADGDYVHVARESVWYAWQASTDPAKPPRCPRARAYPAYLVWVEG